MRWLPRMMKRWLLGVTNYGWFILATNVTEIFLRCGYVKLQCTQKRISCVNWIKRWGFI